jgi:hypothetical protein
MQAEWNRVGKQVYDQFWQWYSRRGPYNDAAPRPVGLLLSECHAEAGQSYLYACGLLVSTNRQALSSVPSLPRKLFYAGYVIGLQRRTSSADPLSGKSC